MSITTPGALKIQDPKEYQRRIRAWTMYDWANSAFATTIMAAVLPAYYSSVAGANLPSESIATAYWSLGLSLSLFLVAIISPILGTISDVMRGKKKFLSVFVGLGIVGTGLLVLVSTGDFILASILFIIGRIGFAGANVFYDALLPHVASKEDQDEVSTKGYALGYLGGGLLLAVNITMIMLMPGTWGARLSFLSVAIWWGVFSIPIFKKIPEPASSSASSSKKVSIILKDSFKQMKSTFKDIKKYKELFKFLIAFLIYNDGIGTIIGVAVIYGAELGFGTIELILALLLVQFVGIPYSLIFGKLPSKTEKRKPFFLAFIVLNLIFLPLAGMFGLSAFPQNISGAPLPVYETTTDYMGEGFAGIEENYVTMNDTWETFVVSGSELEVGGIAGFINNPFGDTIQDVTYAYTTSDQPLVFAFNGQEVRISYMTGPEQGIITYTKDSGEAQTLDTYNAANRYTVYETIEFDEPGHHELSISSADGKPVAVAEFEVLSAIRQNNLGLIFAYLLGVNVLLLGIAWLIKGLFKGLAAKMTTKNSIYLALLIYIVIAFWAYFLNSTVEFWFLAWMVAVVQGGSQALSRSMYSSMTPASKSGEFFGFFGVMEKFASLIGPLLFAAAGILFGNSRPAVASLSVLFVIGFLILRTVDEKAGRKVADEESQQVLAD